MLGLNGKLSENLIILVLISFAFTSILGMGMSMEIKDGQMSGCPFMADPATVCQMSVAEHIAKWQHAFLGIPTKANFLALAVVALTMVLIPFVKLFPRLKKLTESAARLLAYHGTSFAKIFNPLLAAFSGGILNPRIYEPAYL